MAFRVGTYVGSLVDEALGAHAIVNASNPSLGLGSGFSGAIREACGGTAFQAEVRRAWEDEFDEPLEVGDCVVTSSGISTAFRWVLHVPAVDYKKRDRETGGSSGPSRVRGCTTAALNEAVLLAQQHELVGQMVVGVPLLGAGHGGLGAVASAAAMMEAISANEQAREVLASVRFAVLEEPLARLVENAASRFSLPYGSNGDTA